MSITNFSYDYILQMEAQQAAHVAAQQSSNAASGPLTPPYAPPSDWSSGTSFDITIPYNQDGTIDVNALLEKLRKMLYYANQGDQMDFNSMLDITSYLMNIAGVWSQLKAQGADGKVEQFLNLPFNGTTLVQYIATDVVQAMIYGTFYKDGKNQAATEQFAQQFIATLQGLSANTDILNPILQAAQAIGNKDNLDSWMNDPTNQNATFDEFSFNQTLDWETDFSMNDSTSSYMDQWRGTEINDLIQEAGASKNPFLAYILIMSILMDENGDIQTQIGGRGALMNTMTNALGNQAAGLNSQWSSGNFTPDAAKAFFQKLQNLFANGGDARFKSIFPQIQQVYNDLTGSNSQVSVTFKDHTGATVTMTVGQLYQDMNNPQSPYFGHWDDMSTALNSLQPSTTPGTPTLPGFATIANDLGQVTTSVTSASSAQGQIVQNLEGISEKDLAFVTAAANEIVNADKVIVQNMSTAGN